MTIFTPVGTWAQQHRTSNGLGPQHPPHSDPTTSWDKSLELVSQTVASNNVFCMLRLICFAPPVLLNFYLLVGGIFTLAYAQIFKRFNYSIFIAINYTVIADIGHSYKLDSKHYHFILQQPCAA